MTENPLQKLYRNKNLYVSLPSQGRFYDSGIKLSVDNELGIKPMTAVDEIKLKTPDALFNGEALYELCRSCVPDINNPEEIPACDVDKLLLAIRVATSGTTLDVDARCPECGSKEQYEVDITAIMNTAQTIPEDNVVELDDGTRVTVRPYTLKNQIRGQIESFYQYRMQELLDQSDRDDEARAQMFNEAFVKAIALQTSQVADCIIKVDISDENGEPLEVREYDYIFEWVEQMDRNTHHKISERINQLSDPRMKNSVKIKCASEQCGHVFETGIDLNPVNFFWPQQ